MLQLNKPVLSWDTGTETVESRVFGAPCVEVMTSNEKTVLKSHSVLSKAALLLEEEEAEDGGDDCLGQGEEKEGRLHSSAQPLL